MIHGKSTDSKKKKKKQSRPFAENFKKIEFEDKDQLNDEVCEVKSKRNWLCFQQ